MWGGRKCLHVDADYERETQYLFGRLYPHSHRKCAHVLCAKLHVFRLAMFLQILSNPTCDQRVRATICQCVRRSKSKNECCNKLSEGMIQYPLQAELHPTAGAFPRPHRESSRVVHRCSHPSAWTRLPRLFLYLLTASIQPPLSV